MTDTIRTPEPEPKGPKKTINPPTSWVETRNEPLPPETEHTIVAPASVDEFPEEVRPHVLDPNHQVNQYILVKVLGKGGMGEVWKAWDRKLSRWAAIKFLLGESADGVARFKREAKMAARLSHPNIAPVHEVGEAPSRQPGQPVCHFLAMEYIDGSTLGSAKLSMRDRIDVFVKVAQGIDAAHRGGVVHRDIKPANIMLTKENWPYVMDFGLAKSLDGDNNLSATGAVMGTPAFMPPEQVEGRLEAIGAWSDVYSLGATMYAVFCGAHPFTAQTTLQLLQKVCNEAPPPPRQKNPEISAELEAVILKAMAKKKEERYASAGAVADSLKKLLARLDAPVDAAPAPAPVLPKKPSSAAPLVAALLLILAVGAGAAVWWFKSPKPVEPVAVIDPGTNPPKKEPPIAPVVADPKPEVKPEPKPEPKPEVKPEVKPLPVAPTADQGVQRGFEWLANHARKTELSTDADYWAACALMLGRSEREKVAVFLKGSSWKLSAKATSTAAARALALALSGDATLQELTAECAQYLVETQGPNGLWADATEASLRLDDAKPAGDSPFVLSGDPARKRCEIVKRGTARKAPDGDLGTTQLALLGLYAAENCGHRVPMETWKRALDGVSLEKTPEAAAIVCVVLCRQALGDPDPVQANDVRSALRALKPAGKTPTELAAVERAGGLLSTARLGDEEWYGAGAKALAAAQRPDGSWVEEQDPVGGTARALIFLARGTAALKAAGKRGGAGRLEMKSIGGVSNLMFVLDASGYMRQELDNRERFDVAKATIAKVVEKLPEGSIVGLRVFGNRKGANEPGCETDSTLVTAPGPLNRRQMAVHMGALQVKGWSPLTFSLIEVAKDLARIPPEVEVATVLFVDGLDTDRKSDPVPASGDLAASRPGLKVHVVGFNTDDEDIRERLRKMADAGGGVYIPARNAKTLTAQVLAATVGEQDYSVLNEKGETVAKGRLGEACDLPEGRYTVVVGRHQEKVWINPALTTRIIVNQQKLAH